MRLKRLEIDATQAEAEDRITAGVVRFRAFGQRSSLLVPLPDAAKSERDR